MSEEDAEAIRFVREKKIRAGMKRARGVGAFWMPGKSFYVNKLHYTMESALENPGAMTLFVCGDVCLEKENLLSLGYTKKI